MFPLGGFTGAADGEAEATWHSEAVSGADGFTDEVVDSLLADAVQAQHGGEVRLRLFGDPSCANVHAGPHLTPVQQAIKRRLASRATASTECHPAISCVHLPHALLSSSSQLHSALLQAPSDALQLRNVRLTRLTGEGLEGAEVTFDTQQRLTNCFADLCSDSRARPESESPSPELRVRIQGELCGPTAIVGQLASDVTDLQLSFEATVHPSEFDLSSYILPLSREARSHAGPEEQLTEHRHWTQIADTARPKADIYAFYRQLEEKRLQQQHPEDWTFRRMSLQWEDGVAARFRQLKSSTTEMAAVQSQLSDSQRVYDEVDEALKQRWMQTAKATSPGVDPVWLHVDDATVQLSAQYAIPGMDGAFLPLVGGLLRQERGVQIVLSLDTRQQVEASRLVWSWRALTSRSFHMLERLGYQDNAPLNPHMALPARLSDTIRVLQVKLHWILGTPSQWTLHLSYTFAPTTLHLVPGVTLLHATQHITSAVIELQSPNNCESRMDLDLTATWKSGEGSAPSPPLPSPALPAPGELCIPFSIQLGRFGDRMNWKVKVALSAAPELFDVFNRARRQPGADTPYAWATFPSTRSLARRWWPSARFVETATALHPHLQTEIRLEASATRASYLRLHLIDQGLIGCMEIGLMEEEAPNANAPIVMRVMWRGPQTEEEKQLLDDDAATAHRAVALSDEEPPSKKAKALAEVWDSGAGSTSSERSLPIGPLLRGVLTGNNLAELLPVCPSRLLDVVSFTTVCTLIGALDSPASTVHLRADRESNGPNEDSLVVLREPGFTLLRLKDHLIDDDKSHWPGLFGVPLPPLGQLALSFVILMAPSPLLADHSLNEQLAGKWYDGPYISREIFPAAPGSKGARKGNTSSKGASKGFLIPVGAHFLLQDKRSRWFQWLTVEEARRPPAPVPPPMAISPESIQQSRASIPVALLDDPRSSDALVHHLCSWLDSNTLLFGLRRLNRQLHQSNTLTDGSWWKRRLQAEHGPRVVRWSDEVMQYWRSALTTRRRSGGKQQTATATPLPVWFEAAVHLQVRLNRFATGILRQSIPQLRDERLSSGEVELETGEGEHLDGNRRTPSGSSSTAAVQGISPSIPSAFHYLLTTSPPFHPSNLGMGSANWEVLAHRGMLQSAISAHEGFESGSRHPHLLWFAYEDQEEGTWFAALFTGVCPLRRTVDGVESAPDDEEDEKATTAVGSTEYVDRPITDLNHCPVIVWEVYQHSVSIAAINAHDFLEKREAFAVMANDSEQYNADAAKIASSAVAQPVDQGIPPPPEPLPYQFDEEAADEIVQSLYGELQMEDAEEIDEYE